MMTYEIPTKERVGELAKEGFEQVCIWSGTVVVNPEKEAILQITDFENWIQEQFGVRVKYLEEVKTNPDETGPGGRNDLFFVVHSEDISKFAIPRLKMGIRWYEDVVSYNDHSKLYPQEILEKYPVRW